MGYRVAKSRKRTAQQQTPGPEDFHLAEATKYLWARTSCKSPKSTDGPVSAGGAFAQSESSS